MLIFVYICLFIIFWNLKSLNGQRVFSFFKNKECNLQKKFIFRSRETLKNTVDVADGVLCVSYVCVFIFYFLDN